MDKSMFSEGLHNLAPAEDLPKSKRRPQGRYYREIVTNGFFRVTLRESSGTLAIGRHNVYARFSKNQVDVFDWVTGDFSHVYFPEWKGMLPTRRDPPARATVRKYIRRINSRIRVMQSTIDSFGGYDDV